MCRQIGILQKDILWCWSKVIYSFRHYPPAFRNKLMEGKVANHFGSVCLILIDQFLDPMCLSRHLDRDRWRHNFWSNMAKVHQKMIF